jgi:hypothetical protein
MVLKVFIGGTGSGRARDNFHRAMPQKPIVLNLILIVRPVDVISHGRVSKVLAIARNGHDA